MPSVDRLVPIPGSEYVSLPGARAVGAEQSEKPIRVTAVVRRRSPLPALHDDPDWARSLPQTRQEPGGDALARTHRTDPEDLAQVESFASERGLRVVESSPTRRHVVLEGTPAQLGRAFATDLVRFEHPQGEHRGHTGAVRVPERLAGVVPMVLGLDDRPLAHPKSTAIPRAPGDCAMLRACDLADIYAFPKSATGRGERIGIIELGGGFRREDLEAFFAPGPVPKVTEVAVGSGSNRPEPATAVGELMRFMRGIGEGTAPTSPPPEVGKSTVEVTMDVELAGALAPDAEIIVYFAENTELGLYDALHAALDAEGLRPCVLSLSWSWSERGDAFEARVNDLLAQAAHANVTFCTASGDFGSRGLPLAAAGNDELNPQFPATSPYALACGGTTLDLADGAPTREVVWNAPQAGMASGGGISRCYPLPLWQQRHEVPTGPGARAGRGVPDVCATADPRTQCAIFAGGEWGPAAGTSAVAPLWAALVARLNESLGTPVGYLNPLLYRLAASDGALVRDVVQGDNGAYRAARGWDPCTGLGSPRGDELLAALRGR